MLLLLITTVSSLGSLFYSNRRLIDDTIPSSYNTTTPASTSTTTTCDDCYVCYDNTNNNNNDDSIIYNDNVADNFVTPIDGELLVRLLNKMNSSEHDDTHDLATPTTNDNQVSDTDNANDDEVRQINFKRKDDDKDDDDDDDDHGLDLITNRMIYIAWI